MEDTTRKAVDEAGRRACEPCRTKKIRCDRTLPCSNCVTSKIIKSQRLTTSQACKTATPVQRVQKQRVHLSNQYERKLDRLESRLDDMQSLLANIAAKLDRVDMRADLSPTTNRAEPPLNRPTGDSPSLLSTNIEESSKDGNNLDKQSDYIRDFLCEVVGQSPLVSQDSEVRAALAALEELVASHNRSSISTMSTVKPVIDRPSTETDPSKLAQPPWDMIRIALEKAMEHPTMIFAALFSILKMRNLYEVVEEAYLNPASCSVPRRLLAHGVLYNIFTEFSSAPWSGTTVAELTRNATLARMHLDIALRELDMLLPASYENVMALSLGTACAVEMCKPSLALVLVTKAAELCQSLGYHRVETMSNDSKDVQRSKMHLFWMIYMFDKQLSLRLGRASAIQDWDISLPDMGVGNASVDGFENSDMLSYWVKVARIQGKIYETLFSPGAFLKSPSERREIAADLIVSMEQAWHQRGFSSVMSFTNLLSPNETEIPSERKRALREIFKDALEPMTYVQDSFDRVEDVFFHTDVVVHYSTCALAERATCSGYTFSTECLQHSRAALVAHMRCNSQFNSNGSMELWSGYLHWSILQAPLAPFIFLFCNAIQEADGSDLQPLADFVDSLESCRSVSEGANKLYKMCLLFLKVARLYVQAKTQHMENGSGSSFPHHEQSSAEAMMSNTSVDFSMISQFDPHLNALGLVSGSVWPMSNYLQTSTSQAQQHESAAPSIDNHQGFPAGRTAYGSSGVSQNVVKDWFSSSRYLINFMDSGPDSQMTDMIDAPF